MPRAVARVGGPRRAAHVRHPNSVPHIDGTPFRYGLAAIGYLVSFNPNRNPQIRQKSDNKIFKSEDLKKIADLKIWTTDTANMDTTKQLRHLLANWTTINIEEV